MLNPVCSALCDIEANSLCSAVCVTQMDCKLAPSELGAFGHACLLPIPTITLASFLCSKEVFLGKQGLELYLLKQAGKEPQASHGQAWTPSAPEFSKGGTEGSLPFINNSQKIKSKTLPRGLRNEWTHSKAFPLGDIFQRNFLRGLGQLGVPFP